MNIIFCCVFNQEKYVDMFLLLLESIFIYGNLDDKTHILIYTSTPFMNIIKKTHLFNDEKIKFEINDTYDNIDKSCKARLDLFNLSTIQNYDKILYLDTDILIKNDINNVFNICKDDLLYVLEEGEIHDNSDFWGNTLFKEEIYNYNDKTAFTSGILLFNNCDKIKYLFNKINEDIDKRPNHFTCYDQPYIVYNAFRYNLYNNKLLKAFAVNNDNNIYSDKVIHHFPGGPGVYQHKIVSMTEFMNKMKLNTYSTYSLLNDTINIEHDLWTCSSEMRIDIMHFFCSKKNFKVVEIGSHKGYSTKVLSKIFSKVYAVDNNIEWTNFNKNYNKDATNIEYIMLDLYKNNWSILPEDIEVSFIDADHSYNGCKSDIINSIKHFKNLKYIIFDDYGVWSGVKQIIDELINNKTLKFERFIGINNVPGPNGIVKNVNEGIICSVNEFINNNLKNKTYTWEDSHIKFLDYFKMNAFGEGHYEFVDKNNIIATFGGRTHYIKFSDNYTSFSSTRKDDLQIVKGIICNY